MQKIKYGVHSANYEYTLCTLLNMAGLKSDLDTHIPTFVGLCVQFLSNVSTGVQSGCTFSHFELIPIEEKRRQVICTNSGIN